MRAVRASMRLPSLDTFDAIASGPAVGNTVTSSPCGLSRMGGVHGHRARSERGRDIAVGRQANERQDELWDLRRDNRKLLRVIALMLCGDEGDQQQARVEMLQIASDPLMAKKVLNVMEVWPPMPDSFAQEVAQQARQALGLKAGTSTLADQPALTTA